MLEVTEIDVEEINEFVKSQEFGMLCMILEILVFFHNAAIDIDARIDLKILLVKRPFRVFLSFQLYNYHGGTNDDKIL